MTLRGVLAITCLAAACGCKVYDESLLERGPAPDEPVTDASNAGGAGGAAPRVDAVTEQAAPADTSPGKGGGAAGADVSVPPDTAGGVGGSAGGDGCVPPVITHATIVTPPMLATFEAGSHTENGVLPTMYWYAFTDETGTTGPDAGPFWAVARVPVEANNNFAGHFTGAGHTSWGGGIGFSCAMPIDASAYAGVTFWAKGAGSIIPMILGTVTTDGYCVCDPGTCNDTHRGNAVTLTATWTQYTVKWAELHQLHSSQTFDPSGVLGVNFTSSASSWDFWIDDVALTQ